MPLKVHLIEDAHLVACGVFLLSTLMYSCEVHTDGMSILHVDVFLFFAGG